VCGGQFSHDNLMYWNDKLHREKRVKELTAYIKSLTRKIQQGDDEQNGSNRIKTKR
jgi:hypothetical protein